MNSLIVLLTRGLGLIASLLMLPAYINYFDDQRVLGVWFTLISIINWFLTFDLGVGNGLRNKLVKPIIDNDFDQVKKYISSAYFTTILLVIVIFIIGLNLIFKLNWNEILNISSIIISNTTLSVTIFILFIGILFQTILKLLFSILYAMQKSALPNILSLISSILLLVYLLNNNPTTINHDIIKLAYANVIFMILPLFFATITIFLKDLKNSRPSFRYVDFEHSKQVISLGLSFFSLQIISLIITSTNELLITVFTSPQNTVDFQIYNKLFLLTGTFFSLALIPIWSAVTKASVEKNYNWLKKLYDNLIRFSIFFIFLQFLLILFLQIIVDYWIGAGTLKINYYYSFIFAIFSGLYIWHSVITSIVNGLNMLSTQFKWLGLGALVNIPLTYVLFIFFDSWIVVVIANIISLLPYCILQPIYIKKILNALTREEDKFVH